jgi:type I restriction enzyme S subunit
MSTVGDEFTIQLGKMLDAAKNIGVPKPYIGNRAVQWGRVVLDDVGSVRLTSSDLPRFRLHRDDLVVCEGGEIGRAAIWDEPIPECYYQKALHRLQPKRDYSVYLMMSFLQLWATQGRLLNCVTQTSIAHLPKDKFELVPLPVPPAPEQQAIAAALSDVDELIGALDKLIAKKRAIKRAAMQQLLTGKTRLPGFSGKWRMSAVGSEFEMQLGKMLDAAKNTGVPKPYVGNRAVQWGLVDTSELQTVPLTPLDLVRFRLRKGDLLVCEGGEVGRAAIWDEPIPECYYQKAIHRLRPRNGYDPYLLMSFLYLWSSTGYLSNFVTQTSIAHLPKDKFAHVPLPMPPPSEQQAISEVLADMDAEIAALERRRDKTKAIKQGMMQALLTGRVRLVKPAGCGEAGRDGNAGAREG